MSRVIELVEVSKDKVASVGDPVTSDEIVTYRQLREIEDRSYQLRTIVGAWETQQAQERMLRRSYAGWLLVLLFFQVIVINVVFFLIGLKYLIVEEWLAKTFIIAVFAEIAAMTLVVVRYLFPRVVADFRNVIEKPPWGGGPWQIT